MGQDRYPWYARTRCFIRPAGADWLSTIADVSGALRKRIAHAPA